MICLPAFRKRTWDGTLETAGVEKIVSDHCVGPRCACVWMDPLAAPRGSDSLPAETHSAVASGTLHSEAPASGPG
ncbi:unnamed protein product [Arctogadus glacialis]